MTSHVVLLLNASPHRTLRLVTDVQLRLADTIGSVRMGQRLLLYEPPSTLVACERRQEAYAEVRKSIQQAGGIAKWMERFLQAAWRSKADCGEVRHEGHGDRGDRARARAKSASTMEIWCNSDGEELRHERFLPFVMQEVVG